MVSCLETESVASMSDDRLSLPDPDRDRHSVKLYKCLKGF